MDTGTEGSGISDESGFSLRPASRADEDALYAVHRSALRDVVARVYGAWDEAFQRRYFAERFDPGETQVVVVDGRMAGFIRTIERADELVLASIELVPEFQHRGIGTAVLRMLLGRAHRSGRTLSLRVLKSNRAKRLYERAGLRVVREGETHWYMESGL
jgi:ribosomal protein S18 acetylase RimI-like enzyme